MREIALYVHVPFCIRKCRYCDFVSFPNCSEESIRHYFLTVAQELHFRIIHNKLQGTHLKSVYFGGGTPSLVPSDILSNFLQLLRQYFILDHSIEITVEANPGTIHSEELRNLSNIGINRLSIGIQSFQDRYLSFLGRTYCSKDVFQLLDELKTSEIFQNYSFDLIYGLPFQTFSEWKAEIKTLIRYQPPHFSIYNLTVNRKVPLYPLSTHHPMVFPDPDLLAGMYRWTKIVVRKQRYERYEISNFAQPGYECIHNCTYWRNQEYVGLGISACSYLKGERERNTQSWKRYREKIENHQSPVAMRDVLSLRQKLAEEMILALRTQEGIVPETLLNGYPKDLVQEKLRSLRRFVKTGLVQVNEERWTLSSRGAYIANQIFVDLLD